MPAQAVRYTQLIAQDFIEPDDIDFQIFLHAVDAKAEKAFGTDKLQIDAML